MLRIKLNGGALYIALIISIVTGIILSVFILIGFYNQKQVLSQISFNQLRNNLNSAFNIAQSDYFQDYENNKWTSIGTDNDSIRIKKIQWGAYSLISTETKNNHYYLKQSGLYGTTATNDTALLVCDQGRAIGLSGKIKFNGYCYFPKAGYKPAFVEGQSFNSTNPINALIRQAPTSLPQLKKSFLDRMGNCISKFNPNTDSIVSELPDKLNNSFSAKTVVVQLENIHLNSNQLTGNLKLIGNNSVVVENTSSLNNILIVASTVRVKKGFTGSLNIIASDSIIVEEECVLNYPSSLTVINDEIQSKNLKGLFIEKKATIYGSLICINAKEASISDAPRLFIKLSAECEVYGLLYTEGYAHLQGKIYGSAFCNKLLIKTASAVYENHMMDCEIDPKKYANSITVPGIFSQKSITKCCKWL